jgi:hypothetical protein
MEYVDKVLIKLKRKYSKDEVFEAVVAQNTRYENEIKALKSEIEQLKTQPPTKTQLRETKGQKAIDFLKYIYPQGRRSNGVYTFKINKDIVKEINRTIFS